MKNILVFTIILFLNLSCAEFQKAIQDMTNFIGNNINEMVEQDTIAAGNVEWGIDEQKEYDYSIIDQHVLNTPANAEKSIQQLTAYIIKPAKNEREKVRALFRWITNNIAYDTKSFFAGGFGDVSPNGVFKNRNAVCSGYANLFNSMAAAAGIRSLEIQGWAKGYGYETGGLSDGINHAWNAVEIDKKWYLIDSTWGAGALMGTEYQKIFNEFYFLSFPDQLIFSHFPQNKNWQMLETPVSFKEFKNQPYLPSHFFTLGFNSKEIKAAITDNNFRGFPEVYSVEDCNIKIIDLPVHKYIKAGSKIQIKIMAEGVKKIVVSNPEFIDLNKKGNVYSGELIVKSGSLMVYATFSGEDNTYIGLLKYIVE